MSTTFLAHSKSRDGSRIDTVADHLRSVAARAAEFAEAFGAAEEARLCGLLHDLGKYGDLFQKRLRHEAERVDHWSAGAWLALVRFRDKGLAAALAIQGHHIGLQSAAKDALGGLDPARLRRQHPMGLKLSEPREGRMELFPSWPSVLSVSLYDHGSPHAAATMLDVRMLFSALVDADFIETEAHFNARDGQKVYRQPGPELNPAHALDVLLDFIRGLARRSEADVKVNRLRSDLLDACLEAAHQPPGQFTLTAPTGSGKTLAMLAFALRHAATHGLRRVVFVIPYLSIIEQTAYVYREVFAGKMGQDFVVEHHSLAGVKGNDDGQEGDRESQRLLAENWDAPIIVTTSVQLLESLFSNRPSACRKLHRLARSVILFDEVQTLPVRLAVPTLATLSRLIERYSATVVFSTATQPAFSHLDEYVKRYCACGWQPHEIVPDGLKLFERARRTKVSWPEPGRVTGWDELVALLAAKDCRQVLCIVNLKRHALELFRLLLSEVGTDDGLFHLSTNMCPAHRKLVLDEVRRRLADPTKPVCRLISTQCVEAGVDVDFPVVYRAWGPLDSIAQAAGRCNRNGLLPFGYMRVFFPADDSYPPGAYEQAASVARIVAATATPDLDSPAFFAHYYRQLYDMSKPQERAEELRSAIERRDFAGVADLYRVIEQDAINVLVPYDAAVFESLRAEVRRTGLTREWIERARPHAVSLFRPRHTSAVRSYIAPLPDGRGQFSDEWFEYVGDESDYNTKTGLVVPKSIERLLIA